MACVVCSLGAWGWSAGAASAHTPRGSAGAASAHTGRARADTGDGPQYGSIGQYGEVWRGGGFDATAYDGGRYDKPLTPGRFLDPVGFTVDTADQRTGGDGTAVYVLDRTSNLPANTRGRTTWRLQKLDDRGAVLGTDEFSLPASVIDEMLGLTVDPQTGAVYALLLTFNENFGFEAVDEILGWSTTPSASGQLTPATGLPSDHVSAAVNGYPVPGVLSTAGQLQSAGTPYAMSPQGLARDVSGGTHYLAIQAADPTSERAGSGIVQVCAQTTCGSSARGAMTTLWSARSLSGLPNDNSEANYNPAGISTAADGSLTVLLDEQSGAAPANVDVVDIPASLAGTPTILSSPINSVENSDDATQAVDDAAVFTEDAPIESADPDGATGATILAAPQIVGLANGLYAGEFQPDPTGAPDPQNPAGKPGLWTNHDPGVRLLEPETDGTLSHPTPPLASLFDTLGNPVANAAGTTAAASACSLLDSRTAAAGAPASPYASLAAGAAGALWILQRGTDSAGQGVDPQGGRELIELAPNAGDPCPAPSGTFSLGVAGQPLQPAGTPLKVSAGATVSFDASTIAYRGAAVDAYAWDFGDGDATTTLGASVPPFTWPGPTASESYTHDGLFPVTLTLYGDFGVYTETGAVQVGAGSVPQASFTYAPAAAVAGSAVSFDASASTPSPGAGIVDYHWDWGDGTFDDAPGAADSHIYVSPGTYTARLVIHDSQNGQSAPVSQTVSVGPAPPPPPPATTTTSSTTAAPPPPTPPAVAATFTPRASAAGVVSVTVACPAGQTLCEGSVRLQTASAVQASSSAKRKPPRRTVLLLGRTTFRLKGGHSAKLRVRLTRAGLAFLRRTHAVKSVATVSATNPQGATFVKTYRLTLRYPASRPARHRAAKQRRKHT
jgi:hypothetical protein